MDTVAADASLFWPAHETPVFWNDPSDASLFWVVAPVTPPIQPGGGVWTIPRRQRYELEGIAGVRVGAVSPMRRARAPRRRVVVTGAAVVGLRAASTVRAVDYVATVVIPDDDEVLMLLGGRR